MTPHESPGTIAHPSRRHEWAYQLLGLVILGFLLIMLWKLVAALGRLLTGK